MYTFVNERMAFCSESASKIVARPLAKSGTAPGKVQRGVSVAFYVIAIVSLSAFAVVIHTATPAPTTRYIIVYAKQWSYSPSVITVNQGDTVYITLVSLDVSHGLYIEGYNLGTDLVLAALGSNQTTFHFVATMSGVFIFRCDIPCGFGHAFMTGVLQVDPNNDFVTAGFLAVLVALLSSAYFVMEASSTAPG